MICIDRPVLREIVQVQGVQAAIALLKHTVRVAAGSRHAVGDLTALGRHGAGLRMVGHRLTGTVCYDGTSVIKWDDGKLHVWRKRIKIVPETILLAMPGRPVTHMVDWDRLDDRMTVGSIDEEGVYFRIFLRDYTVPLNDAIAQLEACGNIQKY